MNSPHHTDVHELHTANQATVSHLHDALKEAQTRLTPREVVEKVEKAMGTAREALSLSEHKKSNLPAQTEALAVEGEKAPE